MKNPSSLTNFVSKNQNLVLAVVVLGGALLLKYGFGVDNDVVNILALLGSIAVVLLGIRAFFGIF